MRAGCLSPPSISRRSTPWVSATGFWWSRGPTWPIRRPRCGRPHSRSLVRVSAAAPDHRPARTLAAHRTPRRTRPGWRPSRSARSPARASPSWSPRSAGSWHASPSPTRAAVSGCGWTGCSPSRAAGPWSRGPCRRGPCTLRIRGVQSLGSPAAEVSGPARVALNLRGVRTRELRRGMALIEASRWAVTSVIDVRLTPPPAAHRQPPGTAPAPPGTARLPSRLTLHIGAARTVARARMLGGDLARLSLDHPLPLHVGDRVLLLDPGATADQASGRPVFGATVLDVSPPRLRGTGAAAAAVRELTAWPEPPATPD